MRLLCTVDASKENPLAFSHFLMSEGIQNQCEEAEPGQFHIWVVDEDEVEKAQALYSEFQNDPHNEKYTAPLQAFQQQPELEEEPEEAPAAPPPRRRRGFLSSAPYGPITICIIATAIIFFFWAQMQRGMIVPPAIKGVIQAPILAPIEQKLIYDYPSYFTERDQLFKLYTPKDIEEEVAPSAQARNLITKLQNETTWMGAYERLVAKIRNKEAKPAYEGPMFSDIKEGQVWRLLTPAILHFDFLHIFFNILWFIILGNQIEYRLGALRYLALIVVAAIVTNTAQYLVSGPFFMGLSGVVCAMAAFIWARQQVAPWEGYLLHRLTLIFLGIFIFGMLGLQLVFFFLQIFGSFEASIGIANTAHIMGGVTGYLLGRLRRGFAIKQGIRT